MIRTSLQSIATVFAIVESAIASLAQTGPEQQPPNVEILGHKWSKIAILSRRDYDNVFDPSRSSHEEREARRSQSTRYAYEIKVRNTGDKVIRAIRWDYVFFEPETRVELGRRRFYSPVSLRPKQERKLEGITRYAPTPIVSAKGLQTERVVIQCVILSDGSIWQEPSFTGSCTIDRK